MALLRQRREKHGARRHHPPGLLGHGGNGGVVHILQAGPPEPNRPGDEEGSGIVHHQAQNHRLEKAPEPPAHHGQGILTGTFGK